MGRALVLLLVAVGTGLLLYWLAAPRLLPPGSSSPPPSASASAGSGPPPASGSVSTAGTASPSGSPSSVDTTSAPIAPPRTPQQREQEDLETRRSPYYGWLRDHCGAVLAGWQPSASDPATLELYTIQNDPRLVMQLLAQAVQPYARHYGFTHVTFFLPNAPGSVEHYRLDSEASVDENGAWHAFQK